MRCPTCLAVDDKVVDSRLAEDGVAIRRRRECLTCGRRFTTYERLEETPAVVLKRSGHREPFDRAKILEGLRAACKNRPVTEEALDELVTQVEEEVRIEGPELTSERCVCSRSRPRPSPGPERPGAGPPGRWVTSRATVEEER